ncbi:MAG: phosphatase PAP2 family protein [Planctomycetota bacterium]
MGLMLVGVMVAAWLMSPIDRLVYPLLVIDDVRGKDWHQLFRQIGFIPTWWIVAIIFWRLDAAHRDRVFEVAPSWPPRPAHHRAGLIVLSSLCAGAVAEAFKGIIGRSRPDSEGVVFWFERPWLVIAEKAEPGFGLPSSHAAVAFGGAAMVALLEPRLRTLLIVLASGCALSRLNAGAHTLSDVLAGAAIGIGIAHLLHRAGQGPRRGVAGGLVPLHPAG